MQKQSKNRLAERKDENNLPETHTIWRTVNPHHMMAKKTQPTICSTSRDSEKPIMVYVTLNNAKLKMEVDTGARYSIISETTYKKSWSNDQAPKLKPTTQKLRTYTGELLEILGAIDICVKYKSQVHAIVAAGSGPPLVGRDWLINIQLDWKNLMVNRLESEAACSLQNVLDKHKKVFEDKLGLVQEATAKIYADEISQPRFCRSRTVPYALQKRSKKSWNALKMMEILSQCSLLIGQPP